MKKIIFPFFKNDKHSFLFKKWWFRLGIILYIISIFIIFGVAFMDHMDSFYSCYDIAIDRHYEYSLTSLTSDSVYEADMVKCQNNILRNIPPACGYGVLMVILFHYFVQFILFGIIVDFIYLGSKK